MGSVASKIRKAHSDSHAPCLPRLSQPHRKLGNDETANWGGLEGTHARNSGKENSNLHWIYECGRGRPKRDASRRCGGAVAAVRACHRCAARTDFARAASFRLFSLQRETSQKATSVPGPSRHTLTFPIAILHDPVSEAIRLDRSVCDWHHPRKSQNGRFRIIGTCTQSSVQLA